MTENQRDEDATTLQPATPATLVRELVSDAASTDGGDAAFDPGRRRPGTQHRRAGDEELGRALTRSDLPAELTPESLRGVPMPVLRQALDANSDVLTHAEQKQLKASLHAMFDLTARRVNERFGSEEWQRALRQGGPEAARLRRITRDIERQIKHAERLAPGVDWGVLGQAAEASARPQTSDAARDEPAGSIEAGPTGADNASLADANDASLPDDTPSTTAGELEAELGDKLELASALAELAELSKRQYALERERDLSATRSTFFGFLVSVAVIAAGWAPIVMASPEQRIDIGWLTALTCLIAGAIYVGISRYQRTMTDAREEQ